MVKYLRLLCSSSPKEVENGSLKSTHQAFDFGLTCIDSQLRSLLDHVSGLQHQSTHSVLVSYMPGHRADHDQTDRTLRVSQVFARQEERQYATLTNLVIFFWVR